MRREVLAGKEDKIKLKNMLIAAANCLENDIPFMINITNCEANSLSYGCSHIEVFNNGSYESHGAYRHHEDFASSILEIILLEANQ